MHDLWGCNNLVLITWPWANQFGQVTVHESLNAHLVCIKLLAHTFQSTTLSDFHKLKAWNTGKTKCMEVHILPAESTKTGCFYAHTNVCTEWASKLLVLLRSAKARIIWNGCQVDYTLLFEHLIFTSRERSRCIYMPTLLLGLYVAKKWSLAALWGKSPIILW